MDNTRDLPGYKYYVAPDGTRPAVFVAFLDVAAGRGRLGAAACARRSTPSALARGSTRASATTSAAT